MNICLKTSFIIALLIAGFIFGCIWKQREIDQIQADYAEQVNLALQENREIERRMQKEHDALLATYEKYRKNAETEINNLRRRVLSGDVRLSVPAAANTLPGNSGTGADQARCELDPKTADDLIGIASDGDAAVRELNLCIDMYNAVRK